MNGKRYARETWTSRLSRESGQESVSSDAAITWEDSYMYLEPSLIRHTLRIAVGANRRH